MCLTWIPYFELWGWGNKSSGPGPKEVWLLAWAFGPQLALASFSWEVLRSSMDWAGLTEAGEIATSFIGGTVYKQQIITCFTFWVLGSFAAKAERRDPLSPVNPVGRKLQTLLKWNWDWWPLSRSTDSHLRTLLFLNLPFGGSWLHSFESWWCRSLLVDQPLKIGIFVWKENALIHIFNFRFWERFLVYWESWKVEKSTGKEFSKKVSSFSLAITKKKRERKIRLFYFNTLVYNGIWIISSFFCHLFRCEGTQWIIITAVKGIYI